LVLYSALKRRSHSRKFHYNRLYNKAFFLRFYFGFVSPSFTARRLSRRFAILSSWRKLSDVVEIHPAGGRGEILTGERQKVSGAFHAKSISRSDQSRERGSECNSSARAAEIAGEKSNLKLKWGEFVSPLLSYDDSSRVGNETQPGLSRAPSAMRLCLDSILIFVYSSYTPRISLASRCFGRSSAASCKILISRRKGENFYERSVILFSRVYVELSYAIVKQIEK